MPSLITALLYNFRWDVNPEIFTIPEISLPFTFNLMGSVIGFFGYLLASGQIEERVEKLSKKSEVIPIWMRYRLFWMLPTALIVGNFLGFAFGAEPATSIGPIAPRWYGLLFALAFVFGFLIGKKEFQDSGRSVEEMEGILMRILVATVIGARLGHVLFYDPVYYFANPLEILMVQKGGLASHGAALAIIGTIWWITRSKKDMSFYWLADRVALPATLGGAFIRSGNFFNSEIVGKPTDSAFGVIFTRLGEVPLHPSQLYEAIAYFAIFGILWFIYQRAGGKPKEGLILSLYLILVFSARFLIEFSKSRQAEFALDWSLSMGQWLSIPIVLAGVWVWLQIRISQPTESSN